MTICSFEDQAPPRVRWQWSLVPGTFRFSASSLDEFSTELSAALVAGHVPVGNTVRVVQVFIADEDEWDPSVPLDDIPDKPELQLETAPAQPLPHDVVYDDAKFLVGEPGAASPIAQDATGAVIAIDAASLSFQLRNYAALEWLFNRHLLIDFGRGQNFVGLGVHGSRIIPWLTRGRKRR